jgi:hypothetical protein
MAMSEMKKPGQVPKAVIEKLERLERLIQTVGAAERLWERVFTEADHERLGSTFQEACKNFSPIGMWITLHGGSKHRAVIDIAIALNFVDQSTYEWFLREVEETLNDRQSMIDAATSRSRLVLIENTREAYCDGEKFEIEWKRKTALWNFLWELGKKAKFSQVLSPRADEVLSNLWSLKDRLINREDPPTAFKVLIEAKQDVGCCLNLSPEQITLFVEEGDRLVEWNARYHKR